MAAFTVSVAYFIVALLIAVTDIRTHLIPNRLIALLLAIAALRQAFWPQFLLSDAVWGALLGSVLLFAIAVLTNGGIGGGDVKLMLPLGFYFGLPDMLLLLLLALVFAGLSCALLLVLRIKKRKDTIPMAPYFVAAALVMALVPRSVANLFVM